MDSLTLCTARSKRAFGSIFFRWIDEAIWKQPGQDNVKNISGFNLVWFPDWLESRVSRGTWLGLTPKASNEGKQRLPEKPGRPPNAWFREGLHKEIFQSGRLQMSERSDVKYYHPSRFNKIIQLWKTGLNFWQLQESPFDVNLRSSVLRPVMSSLKHV